MRKVLTNVGQYDTVILTPDPMAPALFDGDSLQGMFAGPVLQTEYSAYKRVRFKRLGSNESSLPAFV